MEFFVSTILVDLLPGCIHWCVLFISPLYSPVGLILSPVGLLPSWADRAGISVSGIVEPCIQFFLQDHVRLSHAQHFLSGSYFSPSYLQPEDMISQKVILEYPTLKALFNSLYFNNNLCKSIDIRPLSLLLPFNDHAQSNYRHMMPFLGGKVWGEPLVEICP